MFSNDLIIVYKCFQLKKERALTDIQLQNEREYNVQLEQKLQDTTTELTTVQTSLQTMESSYQQEIEQLKESLRGSLERERKLQELNEEAYSLLTLYGLKQITEVNPYAEEGNNKVGESMTKAAGQQSNNAATTATTGGRKTSPIPTAYKSSLNTHNHNNGNGNNNGTRRPGSAIIPTMNFPNNNTSRPMNGGMMPSVGAAAIPTTAISHTNTNINHNHSNNIPNKR